MKDSSSLWLAREVKDLRGQNRRRRLLEHCSSPVRDERLSRSRVLEEAEGTFFLRFNTGLFKKPTENDYFQITRSKNGSKDPRLCKETFRKNRLNFTFTFTQNGGYHANFCE